LSVRDSFCSEFAGGGLAVDGEVLDEGADDAFAFFRGAVFEELPRDPLAAC
jgi:hypothetical protein